MNIKKKLTNPFALVAQGFAVGAALFVVTIPSDADSQQDNQPQQSAVLPENLEA
jgi:hypothetical protein